MPRLACPSRVCSAYWRRWSMRASSTVASTTADTVRASSKWKCRSSRGPSTASPRRQTPVLDRLCRKIVWPSDLAVPADDHMEICETSRTLSPFSFNSARVGNRINWLMTGLGRAYLAFCPEEERQRVVTRLRDTGNPQDRLASQPSRLDAILAETRERGYGMRDPAFYGGFYERPFDDQLAGIAVPLGGGDHVYGSINILWVRRAMTVGEIVAHHLADLQTAAAEIVSMLA
jgi:IclR family transcriptional regulator, mhp operon transcriptional activator